MVASNAQLVTKSSAGLDKLFWKVKGRQITSQNSNKVFQSDANHLLANGCLRSIMNKFEHVFGDRD